MGKKLLLAIALLALLSAQAFAGVTSRTFTYVAGNPPITRYITTDLNITPSFTANSIYCVGQQISPASIYSKWYYSTYETALANQVNDQACLISSTAVNTNQPPVWITSYQYSEMINTNPYFPSPSSYSNYLSGIGVSTSVSDEKSRYMNPAGGIWTIGGNQHFKADAQVYCKGNASIVSSNPAYSQTVAYLGQPNPFSPITFSQTGNFTFTSQLALHACLAGGVTHVNSPCTSAAYFYKDLASPTMTFTSAQKTITVKNPFSCNSVQFSNAQLTPSGTVTPGQQLSYSFSVTNPSTNGEAAKITNISASWPYSQPTVNGGLPQTIQNNGNAVQISGTLAAPSQQGTYNFNLVVNYSSATADCSGSVKYCTHSFPFSITVGPPSNPVSCTLAFENHGTTFTAPDSANVTATCRASNNAVVDCGSLSWTTTATSGAVNPSSTTTPPQASRTLLSFGTVTSYQNNAIVKAQHAAFSCQLSFNVAGPDYQSTIITPANYAQVLAGTSFNVSVETKNIGAATGATTTTRITFDSAAPHSFNMAGLGQQAAVLHNTSFTCPSQPGLYQLNSTADFSNALTEINENNNRDSAWVNCTQSAPPAKPDYISVIVASDNVPVGTTFNIIVNTANTGNAPATAFSTTQFNITGQAPLLISIPPLGIGGSAANTTTATCPNYATTLYLRSFADLYNQTGESDRTNNLDTDTVNCYVPSNLPNYVPNITAPSVAFVNYPFQANFTTRNIGTAAATSSSTTRATFQTSISPSVIDFTVPGLQAGQQQTNTATFICSSTGAKALTETVDFTGAIAESNENDNYQSKQVSCYPEPTNCTLSFVNHAPQFSQNDFAQVRATCFAGMLQTACPPFLWQQSAQGGMMSPPNTSAALHPESMLVLSSAPMPQIAKKVNATSTLPFLNLYCELLFDVNDGSPIGPDYVVSSISSTPHPALIDDVVHFTVKVSNIGNVNATNASTSEAIYSSGCMPIDSVYNLPPIDAGKFHLNSELKCQCIAPGLQSITVAANPSHAQWETNFNNNNLTYTFPCQTVAQRTCSDFI